MSADIQTKGLPQKWVHFDLPSQEARKISPLKTNAQAMKTLTAALRDPLKYSNEVQKIYYIRANPAALKTPMENGAREFGMLALRYGTALSLWGKCPRHPLFLS